MGQMNRRFKLAAARASALLLAAFMLFAGCGREPEGKDPVVVTVNGWEASRAEVMLYMLQVQTEFERAAGPGVWEIEDFSGGKTASEVAKQGALDNLVRVKVLNAKARETGLEVPADLASLVERQADDHYSALEPAYRDGNHITRDLVRKVFLEFQLAAIMGESVAAEVQPTQEEIRQRLDRMEAYAQIAGLDQEKLHEDYTLGYLRVGKADGPQARELLEEARIQVEEGASLEEAGEAWFGEEVPYSLGTLEASRLTADPRHLEAFTKAPGEVTRILEDQDGFLFFLVEGIAPGEPDPEIYRRWLDGQTEAAKELLRRETFERIYQEWKLNAQVQVREDLWSGIRIQ
ncbi:SurA N-terminal domain-containing protein [Anaerotalea alkaliphila]|uniref:PpiC domain-containing protein n=1 Tax=Anaerotalea alkaliphila TaxID=2662126 RepID=A0A7X5HTH1_9FIRM|nr:SurA N-terminal domain-containing protein [Anaerotalea alkaliphila]NDL66372.1 hypothetical protein [Anaerotalea alkaliphila]